MKNILKVGLTALAFSNAYTNIGEAKTSCDIPQETTNMIQNSISEVKDKLQSFGVEIKGNNIYIFGENRTCFKADTKFITATQTHDQVKISIGSKISKDNRMEFNTLTVNRDSITYNGNPVLTKEDNLTLKEKREKEIMSIIANIKKQYPKSVLNTDRAIGIGQDGMIAELKLTTNQILIDDEKDRKNPIFEVHATHVNKLKREADSTGNLSKVIKTMTFHEFDNYLKENQRLASIREKRSSQ